jgi:hypothetical protein
MEEDEKFIIRTSIGNWVVPAREVMFFDILHALQAHEWITRADFLTAEVLMLEESYKQID